MGGKPAPLLMDYTDMTVEDVDDLVRYALDVLEWTGNVERTVSEVLDAMHKKCGKLTPVEFVEILKGPVVI